MSTNTDAAQTAQTDTTQRTVLCRVCVTKLELPHGIAARGKLVHLQQDVYQVHADAGKVRFINYAD